MGESSSSFAHGLAEGDTAMSLPLGHGGYIRSFTCNDNKIISTDSSSPLKSSEVEFGTDLLSIW